MIDLERENLPSCLVSDAGEVARIETDFRTWLKFQRLLTDEHVLWLGIFPNEEPPAWPWFQAALEFLKSENLAPKGTGGRSKRRTLDMFIDGDYIVASFQQAYGIDLTDSELDMHWHRFLALLRGLPKDTKLAEVMGWRAYERRDSKRKPEEVYVDLREMWELPKVQTVDSQDVIAWQKQVFGGITYEGGADNGRC